MSEVGLLKVAVVVVVSTLKTVLTSIQNLFFLPLQGIDTVFFPVVTSNPKIRFRKKRPRESPSTCAKICNIFLKITSSEKQAG